MSTESPMMFLDDMVRAIRSKRKTQTRRIVTPSNSYFGSADKEFFGHADFDAPHPGTLIDGRPERGQYLHVPSHCQTSDYFPLSKPVSSCEICKTNGWEDTRHRLYCRYGVGDRLWIREGAKQVTKGIVGKNGQYKWPTFVNHEEAKTWFANNCYYTSDFPDRTEGQLLNKMFMPRWASRLTLQIIDLRVQRLQDISESDAAAEGVQLANRDEQTFYGQFQKLWESIHGKESWLANPWVWCYTFRVF